MSQGATPWSEFRLDPRDAAHAALRATDADRDIVAQALAEAYADGRLDREEYDERADALHASRTLGELPPLLSELVPDRVPVVRAGSLPASAGDLDTKAVAAYESDRRDALLGFLGPSLICVVIWAVINWGTWDFFWPGFVMAGTLVNVLRVIVRRTDIVEEHRSELERKQTKARNKAQEKAQEKAQRQLEARPGQGEE